MIASLCFCASPLLAQDLAPEASPSPPDAGIVAQESKAADKGLRDTLQVSDADYKACLAELDTLGVKYEEVAPIIAADDADCGILRPLEISETASGISIDPPATLRCETAASLARWTQDFVLPAAQRLEARRLTTIENGSGYICRRRNNAPDGKLSEHGVGNAFDVMGFRFDDGSRIAVQPREADGTLEEAFQDAVRASACLEFSTVLGPGSNALHADHLHLDVIARASGYRLCEQGGIVPE